MPRPFAFLFSILLASLACSFNRAVAPTSTPIIPTSTIQATNIPSSTIAPTTAAKSSSKFGVLASGDRAARPEIISYLTDLGASWVRVNVDFNGANENYTQLFDAGLNVFLMVSNQDPQNADTGLGTLKEFPNAGFPYKSKTVYQQKVRALITSALPYLAKGRMLYVQAENEIGDATINSKSRYWRGTTDQYLTQLQTFYEAVKAINSAIPVVLSSFPSETLDALIDSKNDRHDFAVSRTTTMINSKYYDAVDLHFYGCVNDIAAKVKWFKDRSPANKVWLSTENSGPDYRCSSTPLTYEKDPARYEQLQAEQVKQRLAACAENGGVICLWFSLFDLKGETDVFAHMGLIDSYSNPPRKKAAFEAFKSFVSR